MEAARQQNAELRSTLLDTQTKMESLETVASAVRVLSLSVWGCVAPCNRYDD